MSHPFYSGTYNGHDCYCMTADDRVRRVAEFDLSICRQALQLPDLQTTVRQALERRIRKLERQAEAADPAVPARTTTNEVTHEA